MAGPDLLRGARAPLFDRFGDEAEADGAFLPWHAARHGGRQLSALEGSIQRELERLLNTRCAASLHQLAGRRRSVLDYGLPDYTSLHTADLAHRRQLEVLVRDTVLAFEPRLRDVAVEVQPQANSRHALDVTVSGRVLAAERLEPLSFRIAVQEGA